MAPSKIVRGPQYKLNVPLYKHFLGNLQKYLIYFMTKI